MTNNVQTQKPLSKPTNEIDLQALTTTPFVSSDYMSDRIRNKFRDFVYILESYEEEYIGVDGKTKKRVVQRQRLNDDGTPMIQVNRDLWASMELFTQDFRLGNLNKDEAFYVRYHIDLCTDILTAMPESFNKPALIALERALAVTETSQSKGGFLRRMFNTFFQHSSVKEDAPTKRSFFGLGKKNKVE